MKQKVAILITAAGVVLAPAYAGQKEEAVRTAGQVSASDRNFLIRAAQGGMAEVEMGRMATDKASSEEVKKFGQRMVEDHTKANDKLRKLASDKGVDLPSDVGARHKAAMDRLSKLSGEEFDRAYMRHMVADHRQDLALFKRAASQARDQDLKAFAGETLPTLQEHFSLARQHSASLRGKGAATGEASREADKSRDTGKTRQTEKK